MTLENANELLAVPALMGGTHQISVNKLINALELERIFGSTPGTAFKS